MYRQSWRNPQAILICGSLILMLSLGTRQSFGLFMQPMTSDLNWGREAFAFALGMQNLVWGLAQPFAGMIADKYGAGRVAALGGLLYAVGLAMMAGAETPLAFGMSAGLILGLGLSGTAFGVVMGVVGRAFPEDKRSAALGVVGAGGSFGQFIMLPYGQFLISQIGWLYALLVLAACAFLMVPLASALAGKPSTEHAQRLSLSQALHEAATHRGSGISRWPFSCAASRPYSSWSTCPHTCSMPA